MSSPQLTLNDIINKWKDLVTGSAEPRWDEMEAFFLDVAENKIPAKECMQSKERILRLWTYMNWAEAKTANPTWKEKSWFEARKKATLKTWDKWYTEYKKTTEEEQPKKVYEKPAPAFEDTPEESPIFDNLEDFQKWKARKQKMG